MSLTTNNTRIVSFYKNNKHLNFESVNLSIIDLIERFEKSASKASEKELLITNCTFSPYEFIKFILSSQPPPFIEIEEFIR